MDDAVNETQECRVYEEDAWYSMIEYVLFLKHRKAYEYACESAMGKRVLDFGCGSGYGTARLAKAAASVIGVDASQPAIAYAQEHYRADNLEFRRIPPDCTLPFDDDTFDMAVSFQVIEHMPDVAAYLRLLKRVLKPGGTLLVTTPNRAYRLLPFQPIWQPAHLREYTAAGFRKDIADVFNEFQALGVYGTKPFNQVYIDHYRQTPLNAYVVGPLKRRAQAILPKTAYARIRDGLGLGQKRSAAPLSPGEIGRFSMDDVIIGDDLAQALDFLAICRKR